MSQDSVLLVKSKKFAIRVVRLYQHLKKEKQESVLSKQLLRSGTSVGANVHEGIYGQSRADFVSKMSIALKEAAETAYWLDLLMETDYMSKEEHKSMKADNDELAKMLVSTINSAKRNS